MPPTRSVVVYLLFSFLGRVPEGLAAMGSGGQYLPFRLMWHFIEMLHLLDGGYSQTFQDRGEIRFKPGVREGKVMHEALMDEVRPMKVASQLHLFIFRGNISFESLVEQLTHRMGKEFLHVF